MLYVPDTFDAYSKNLEKRRFCERTLQLAIETCIDISQLLVKELKLGLPTNEASLFEELEKNKLISKKMCAKLKEMKRFRNVLIHKYVEIDNHIVFINATKNLTDFVMFKKEIVKILK